MRIATSFLLLALVLAGCGPAAGPAGPAVPAPDAHVQLQAAMEQAGANPAIVVVRLQYEGRRIEVSSIFPIVLAEAAVGGQVAKTIFRVSDAGDALVMFSRDLPGRKSLRTELAFAQLSAGQLLSFPIVQADGSLKESKFTFERVVKPN